MPEVKEIQTNGILRILRNKYITQIIPFMFKRDRMKFETFLVLPPTFFYFILFNTINIQFESNQIV